MTRRTALQLGVTSLAAAGFLSGCGSGTSASTTSSHQRPRRGGVLRAGLTGGGTTDTIDADNGLVDLDFSRIIQLYDPLVNISMAGGLEMQLAESIEPNADATEWTIRLRPDVTFHSGKSLVADDVLFTFKRILDPKQPLAAAASLRFLDVANARTLDKLTLRVPCHTPFATLAQNLADYDIYIVPSGYNPKRPDGTGAFVFKSFTPGSQSVFVRNANYWRKGLPYIDELVISDYTDPTAQLNALLSGQVDYIDQIDNSVVPAVTGGGKAVVRSNGAAFINIVMRVDQSPFSDNRVRLALKYVVDRPEMRRLTFGGYGYLGNDVPCITDPQYDHSIPQRVQDIDRAKALLKAAGHEHLALELVTAQLGNGVIEQAELFAQQAAAAGVMVTLNKITPQAFYDASYLTRTFTQDDWLYGPYFTQVGLAMVPGAPYNETHFNNPRYNALFAEAQRTVDVAKQTELAHEMQLIEYEEGGNIIPNFTPYIDAHSASLLGVHGSNIGLPSWAYCFKECWFA